MYALRLEPDFINNLTPEGRRWLARAVVNMINIDGKLDPNEMPYMHDAVILIDESERAALLENAQQRNYMELPNLTTDRKYVGELLYYFASIVAADSKISSSEVEFLKALGAKLGLPEQAVQNALDWTTKYLQLQKIRQDAETELANIPPLYQTVESKIHELDAQRK
ncbi:MAG: hypothetical protein MK437_08345 [SAR324 cluster bacterium]|nr:hypothetical protein [SAR324 cluster bacterium]